MDSLRHELEEWEKREAAPFDRYQHTTSSNPLPFLSLPPLEETMI